MDQKEIGRIFYRDGYALAARFLEQEISAVQLKEAIRALHQAVDGLLAVFLERSATEGKACDCKKGCAWCCHQEVFAVTHEFLYLNDYVQKRLPTGTQEEILERAREKVKISMNKSVEEQMQIRSACPFLFEGSCMAYEARPMACRIYLSSSVRSCKKEHNQPARGGYNPDLYEFPLKVGRMLNEGFVAYLKQVGLQTSELPIEQGYSSVASLGQSMGDWLRSSRTST